MKYETTLTKTEQVTVQLFVENRDEAIALAHKSNPGFSTDAVTELLEVDEIGETHVVIETCESCGKNIWEGDLYAVTEDACYVCLSCYNALAAGRAGEKGGE